MTHYSKFSQLLKHSSQKLQVVYTLEEQLTIDDTHFKGVYSIVFISKESPTNME
jgi:hypothetical protein